MFLLILLVWLEDIAELLPVPHSNMQIREHPGKCPLEVTL